MLFSSSFREEPVGGFDLSDRKSLFFIVGPCVIETREITFQVASEVARISRTHGIPMIFKSSFDKANRTSVDSFRGPGLRKALRYCRKSDLPQVCR